MDIHNLGARLELSCPGQRPEPDNLSHEAEQLRSRKRFFCGTHRSISPDETWRNIEPLLPMFGISRIADLTGLDRIGLPVAAAIRPLSRSVVVSAGKGLTIVAAKVSAAMEAIECAHAESPNLPLFYGSRREMLAWAVVPKFKQLPLAIDSRLSDESRIMWAEGRSPGTNCKFMVPYELVHSHYCQNNLPGASHFLATTNGLSSGNTFAEAVAHGVFEVVERDALAKWSRLDRAQRNRRLVSLPARADCYLTDTLERVRRAGFRIGLWDITPASNIPAYHCLLLDEQDPNGHPGTGSGCHPDWRVAAFRALSEAAQVRAVYISGSRDDLRRREYDTRHITSFGELLKGTTQGAPLLQPVTNQRRSFEEDVALVAHELARQSCGPIIIVDLSRDEMDVSVIRIVIPGLEGPIP